MSDPRGKLNSIERKLMNIEIVTPSGKSQIIVNTPSNLKWAKRLFAEGFLQSWEIIA
jgi:hypothetical protein